jgi:predicted nuclease of predicted toxin-antitoxin system
VTKVILDEGVPKQLARRLRDHGIDADALRKAWYGFSNGELLALIERTGYAVLITSDKNLVHLQNLRGRELAIVALPTKRKAFLMGRVADIADTIKRIGPGQHVSIEANGRRIVRQHVDNSFAESSLPDIDPFW